MPQVLDLELYRDVAPNVTDALQHCSMFLTNNTLWHFDSILHDDSNSIFYVVIQIFPFFAQLGIKFRKVYHIDTGNKC